LERDKDVDITVPCKFNLMYSLLFILWPIIMIDPGWIYIIFYF
jgi:hypothetical protein